jgi:hypothetical protein
MKAPVTKAPTKEAYCPSHYFVTVINTAMYTYLLLPWRDLNAGNQFIGKKYVY